MKLGDMSKIGQALKKEGQLATGRAAVEAVVPRIFLPAAMKGHGLSFGPEACCDERPWLEMGASQDAAEMGSMGLGFGPEGSLGSLPFFDNEQPRQPRDTVRGDLPPVPAFGRCASSASFEEALGQPDQEVRFPDTLAEEDSPIDEAARFGDIASLELEPESQAGDTQAPY